MKANFDESLKRLLEHEGGYTNHPSDPGGPTNFGITIFDYQKYINRNGTALDVKNMHVEDAKRIYRAKYWDAMRCDELPNGVDYAVFDFGVNSGVSRSIKFLEKLLGLPEDGASDNLLINRAGGRKASDLINLLCDSRMAFLKGLKTWPTFGKGWARRVTEVRAASLAMVAHGAIPTATPGVSIGTATPKPGLLALILSFFKKG